MESPPVNMNLSWRRPLHLALFLATPFRASPRLVVLAVHLSAAFSSTIQTRERRPPKTLSTSASMGFSRETSPSAHLCSKSMESDQRRRPTLFQVSRSERQLRTARSLTSQLIRRPPRYRSALQPQHRAPTWRCLQVITFTQTTIKSTSRPA